MEYIMGKFMLKWRQSEKHNVKTNDATLCPSCIIRRFISQWQWQSGSLNKKYMQFLEYLE